MLRGDKLKGTVSLWTLHPHLPCSKISTTQLNVWFPEKDSTNDPEMELAQPLHLHAKNSPAVTVMSKASKGQSSAGQMLSVRSQLLSSGPSFTRNEASVHSVPAEPTCLPSSLDSLPRTVALDLPKYGLSSVTSLSFSDSRRYHSNFSLTETYGPECFCQFVTLGG